MLTGMDRVFEELLLLRRWLLEEPEFRGQVGVEQAPPQPGQMGGEVEALAVALGGGGAVTVLVQSVLAWLRSRQQLSALTVRIVHADGSCQEITASGPAADTIAAEVDL